MSNGNFNISGNGVDGEGTFTITNGTAEIGLHMVVGQMAQTQEVVIAADKATAVNSLKSTSENDHTETEITFTKDGRCNRRTNAGQGVLILRSTPPPSSNTSSNCKALILALIGLVLNMQKIIYIYL